MKAIVFIPTYNEKGNIEELISGILGLDVRPLGLELEVLVVDDDSSDGTAQALDALARADRRVSVIHRLGRRGRGLAGREGFIRALERGADYVVEMDADLSHNPEDIPRLLSACGDADVVIGSRFVKGGSSEGRSWCRDSFSVLCGFFCRTVLGLRIEDPTSGFRCFKRHALEGIGASSLRSQGPAIIEEANYRIQKNGFMVKEIPIIFSERRHGTSKLNLRKLAGVFRTLVMVRFSG